MKKRILSALLSICMALTLLPSVVMATSYSIEEFNATNVQNVLADIADVTEGGTNILHAWGWSYENIEASINDILAQGFGTILVSPPNEIKMSTKNAKFSEPAVGGISPNGWWMLYEPAGFQINESSDNALGTKEDFENMCAAAHEKGLKIMVETVVGYMGTDDDYTSEYTNTSTDPRDHLSSKAAEIEPEIYSASAFHSPWVNRELRANYWEGWSDYDIEESLTQDTVDGKPDLATETQIVQNAVYDYLEELVEAGADGFYFNDAARIETANDTYYASDFWEDTLYKLTITNLEKEIYAIGEIIGKPGDGRSSSDYIYYDMDITNSEMSDLVSKYATGNRVAADGAAPFASFTGIPAENSVLWTEQYKAYAKGETSSLTVEQRNKIWALIAARKDVPAIYFARPDDSIADGKASVEAVLEGVSLGTANETAWINQEVAEINRFSKAYENEDEALYCSNNIASIEKGNKGAILVNLSGAEASISITTTLADGTYIDKLTENEFTAENGMISGDIGTTGIAVLYETEEIPGITTYTISFNANGGTVNPATATTEANGKLANLPTPSNSGYSFNGWYTEATGGTQVTTDTVFTTDTTLYALWTPVIVDPTPADLPDTVNEDGPDSIEICNFVLEDGNYLATNDATEVSENYTNGTPYVAVYKNGILYLNGLNVESNTSGKHAISWGYNFMGKDELVIELVDGTTNTLVDNLGSAINGHTGSSVGPSVTIQGNGTLNISSTVANAIWVWENITIQNEATVNLTCSNAGISNNTGIGKILIEPGTNLNISGGEYGIKTDNNRTGTFYVEGGNITLKGNTSAIYHINCDFGNIPVYVSENVSGEGKTLWDGITDITTYKYVSLSGTRTDVTPTYTVTFDANGGTVAPTTATTETDGKLASLPTPTRSGSYRFNGWFTAASGGTEVTTDTVFTEDSTIYAQWAYKGGSGGGTSYYNVTFNTDGGSKVTSQRLRRNAIATEPAEPTKDGFKFEGWYTDKEYKNAYDFSTKVIKNITLYAKWGEAKPVHVCHSEKFKDLDTTKWYHEDVDYVIENNIMLGTSDTVFAPEENLTRGMLVTILYRSEGEPATNRSIPFADVDMGAYYANAVVWAQQNGIVKGISETEYAPDMNVTREQLATIMLRYAQFKGMDAVTTEDNLGFNDASDISVWAVAAMNWGVGRDYIFARTEGAIAPKVAATRAEIAAFIHRYIVSNEK